MSIYKKLFEAKKEIGKISKDSTNPFFKSKYFDINGLLEHVEPILQKHGLLLLQPIIDGKVISEIIEVECEDKIGNMKSEMLLPNIQDPQKLGSAITYYRRYTLQSLLGLQAEDDDANSASKHVNKPVKSKLDAKGLDFLLTRGTVEHINEAFNKREIDNAQKLLLDKKLVELKK
jgi:hypothetical protein